MENTITADYGAIYQQFAQTHKQLLQLAALDIALLELEAQVGLIDGLTEQEWMV